ncbi:MAG TPA: urease accessory protein UreF [Spongiibacteraceae bacterium]|nr:urease accessory protein UreF [Spongiibacteraceae bacterium]
MSTDYAMKLEADDLSRLLQLASPMLPVGAYAYSQGLEWAIETRTVHDAKSTANWIADAIELYLSRFELPVLLRMRKAWDKKDSDALKYWNQFYCAGRDTMEARAETLQMGYSLVRLLDDLDLDTNSLTLLQRFVPVSFPLAYACATSVWSIPVQSSLHAFLWSWAENQVSAAMKVVPLGQVAGQRMLLEVSIKIPDAVKTAMNIQDDELNNFAPGLSIAGSRHETQYSRLFRS